MGSVTVGECCRYVDQALKMKDKWHVLNYLCNSSFIHLVLFISFQLEDIILCYFQLELSCREHSKNAGRRLWTLLLLIAKLLLSLCFQLKSDYGWSWISNLLPAFKINPTNWVTSKLNKKCKNMYNIFADTSDLWSFFEICLGYIL